VALFFVGLLRSLAATSPRDRRFVGMSTRRVQKGVCNVQAAIVPNLDCCNDFGVAANANDLKVRSILNSSDSAGRVGGGGGYRPDAPVLTIETLC